MISGFEFDHLPIYQTTFPNIIRGYGWCDQVNSAVAFTLHKLIDGVDDLPPLLVPPLKLEFRIIQTVVT